MSPLATAPTHSIQIRIPQFIEWPRRRSLGTCEPTLHCACSWGTPASPPPPSSSSAGSRSSSPASFYLLLQTDLSFRCKLLSLFSMSFCPHPQQKEWATSQHTDSTQPTLSLIHLLPRRQSGVNWGGAQRSRTFSFGMSSRHIPGLKWASLPSASSFI